MIPPSLIDDFHLNRTEIEAQLRVNDASAAYGVITEEEDPSAQTIPQTDIETAVDTTPAIAIAIDDETTE